MNLITIFNKITAPNLTETFQFSALPIVGYEEHRIAKDIKGNPVLLISFSENEYKQDFKNIKLQNVEVIFDVQCLIHQNDQILSKKFTTLSFKGVDTSLTRYFLRLCTTLIEELGNYPSIFSIKVGISKFIELFRFATEPPKMKVQGLWSELFFIFQSKDPLTLLKSWHSVPEEKLDFAYGDERIEIKSSSSSFRIHNFSLDQLNSPSETKTVVASILVRKVSVGVNLIMLQSRILERIQGNYDIMEKLQLVIASTLGSSINDSELIYFDYEFAVDSMKLFWSHDIPQIKIEHIPFLVSDIHFKSDLSDLKAIELNYETNLGPLFSSI